MLLKRVRKAGTIGVNRGALKVAAAALLLIAVMIMGFELGQRAGGMSRSVHLAILLPATKLIGDVLERPFRPRRATFYYADYVSEWAHFGLLAVVAILAHLILAQLVDGPMPTGWIALGVYATWRLTSPRH